MKKTYELITPITALLAFGKDTTVFTLMIITMRGGDASTWLMTRLSQD